MEYLNSIWQVGVIALVAGAMIGALAYRLFAPSLTRAEQVRSELEAARQELIDYKASVNNHFDKTSELVSDLTQNYVKVYQHLAEGAQTLGGSRQLNNLLEQHKGKVLLTVGDEPEADEANVAARSAKTSPLPDTPEETLDDAAGHAADAIVGAPGPGDRDGAAKSNSPKVAGVSSEGDEAADVAAEFDASVSVAESGGEAKAGDPVIDVTRIKASAADGGDAEAELSTLIPDPDKSQEAKPTRH